MKNKFIFRPYWPQHRPFVCYVGERYKYAGDGAVFVLKSIDGSVFVFECGRRVTDSIMRGMVRVKTNVSVWKEPVQLALHI